MRSSLRPPGSASGHKRAAAALAWRLKQRGPDDMETKTRAESLALRVVPGSFFGLSAYVGYEALNTLIVAKRPSLD